MTLQEKPIVPISEYWQNAYQRTASVPSSPLPEEARSIDDRVAVLRDGTRLRRNVGMALDDIVSAGDLVSLKQKSGALVAAGRVVRVQWHREYGLRCYDIVYCKKDALRTKTGKVRVLDLNVLNELVTQDGRIVAFFEANEDEVFVETSNVLLD